MAGVAQSVERVALKQSTSRSRVAFGCYIFGEVFSRFWVRWEVGGYVGLLVELGFPLRVFTTREPKVTPKQANSQPRIN